MVMSGAHPGSYFYSYVEKGASLALHLAAGYLLSFLCFNSYFFGYSLKQSLDTS